MISAMTTAYLKLFHMFALLSAPNHAHMALTVSCLLCCAYSFPNNGLRLVQVQSIDGFFSELMSAYPNLSLWYVKSLSVEIGSQKFCWIPCTIILGKEVFYVNEIKLPHMQRCSSIMNACNHLSKSNYFLHNFCKSICIHGLDNFSFETCSTLAQISFSIIEVL